MADLKLPGRMPLDFGRIYDSKISDSLPPPPPGGPAEARWDEDLGKNWILGFTAYLIPAGTGFNMATTEGDVVRWAYQGSGVWKPLNGTASKHLVLEQDGTGLVETQADGTRWTFSYGVGDLWKSRRPDHHDTEQQLVQAEWTYGRDAAGKITAITDPLGHTWTRTYDAAGRLVAIEGPAGTRVEYGHDARHRITSATVVDGVTDPVTTYAWDAAGRLPSKTLPDGASWSYGWDDASRLVSVTGPLARTWTYTRDLAGRVTSLTHPGGQVVTLDRDAAGRLETRTYPGGRVESFTYDSTTGCLVSAEADVDSGVWIGRLDWAYDTMGRTGR